MSDAWFRRLENTTTRFAFWEVTVRGSTVTATWGKIGTAGQSRTWTKGSLQAAMTFARQKMAKKLAGDYVRVVPGARERLEAAPAKATPPTRKPKPKPKGALPQGFIAPRRVRPVD